MQKNNPPEADFFRCPVCENTKIKITDDYWSCSGCGKSYPVICDIPVLVRDWEHLNQEIEQAMKVNPAWYLEEQPPEQISPWRHHIKKRRLYIENILHHYLNEHNLTKIDRLLDLGCGDGNHLSYLQNYTTHLYGSDYNLVRLARAAARHLPVQLFLADILDYPVQNGFFDVIFFSHVLEHIPEDTQALSSAWKILKPGGLLILGIPNEGAWWWQTAYRLQPQTRQTTDHVHFYTSKIIKKLLSDTGFCVLQIEYLGWGPPHWGLDMKIRGYQWVDDGFEILGKAFFPNQASSLYIIATKPEEI